MTGGVFLIAAVAKGVSLDLGGAGSRADYFGNVRPGLISPARFSDFRESLEGFSALTWGNSDGEFLKRRQRRLGMREG